MSDAADHWDGIYADAAAPGSPADFVVDSLELLPAEGTAVDLAGGTGATALWLAAQGLDATLVEVSGQALEIARAAAGLRDLALRTMQHDLEGSDALLLKWDVVVISNFLHRPLLRGLVSLLRPNGLAFVRVATIRNLERNEHPSARFLLEEGELPALCAGLEVVHYGQDWFDGRREARLVARRPA